MNRVLLGANHHVVRDLLRLAERLWRARVPRQLERVAQRAHVGVERRTVECTELRRVADAGPAWLLEWDRRATEHTEAQTAENLMG